MNSATFSTSFGGNIKTWEYNRFFNMSLDGGSDELETPLDQDTYIDTLL